LICNYISRIEEGLQNEFLRIRFNQLPEDDIITFLTNISDSENLNMSKSSIKMIQQLYKSDIRSMINFMQSNQHIINIKKDFYIIDNIVWNNLYDKISSGVKLEALNNFIKEISMNYNIDKKNIVKHFLNYIIRNKQYLLDELFLNFVENIMHFQDCNNLYYINYSLSQLSYIFQNSKYAC
jgi:replication factor C subunit 3/5